MKKLIFLGIVLALGLVLQPTAALAHTEDDPYVADLLAGQTCEHLE